MGATTSKKEKDNNDSKGSAEKLQQQQMSAETSTASSQKEYDKVGGKEKLNEVTEGGVGEIKDKEETIINSSELNRLCRPHNRRLLLKVLEKFPMNLLMTARFLFYTSLFSNIGRRVCQGILEQWLDGKKIRKWTFYDGPQSEELRLIIADRLNITVITYDYNGTLPEVRPLAISQEDNKIFWLLREDGAILRVGFVKQTDFEWEDDIFPLDEEHEEFMFRRYVKDRHSRLQPPAILLKYVNEY